VSQRTKLHACRVLPGAAYLQAVNPFMIIALTPPLTRLWEWQARRGSEPTQITKMGIGAGLLSVSYIILAAAASASGAGTGAGTSGGGGKMGAGWLVLHLTVLTAGELYLSPVGLSFMVRSSLHMCIPLFKLR